MERKRGITSGVEKKKKIGSRGRRKGKELFGSVPARLARAKSFNRCFYLLPFGRKKLLRSTYTDIYIYMYIYLCIYTVLYRFVAIYKVICSFRFYTFTFFPYVFPIFLVLRLTSSSIYIQ